MATTPALGFRHVVPTCSWLQRFRCSSSVTPLPHFSSPDFAGENQKSEESNNNDGTKIAGRTASYFPKRGQTVELVCESLAFKGKGICKVTGTGFVVMCDRALPGERFLGRVTRRKGNYAEVTKVKTISPHWDLVDAPCEYSSYCGGCKTQNLSYEAQLRAKEQQVHELITHVGRFSDKVVLKPIVACDIQFHYRNKMEFSFGSKRWLPKELMQEKQDGPANFALGLHAPGHFDKVLNIGRCLLQSEPANMVLAAVQDFWRDPQLGLSPYDVHSHAGFLKHLMLRTGRDVKTGSQELMVNFVTSSYEPELLKPLIERISSIPQVVSVMNNAEVLYTLIEECAGLRGDGSEVVLDLFCGTGTIGLTLAKRAKHVYGYEVVPQAISDACRNAQLNGIENATFIQGDLNKIGDDFGSNFPRPDIVISDPNRPGMHMKLIKFLLKLKSPRIVYVSCNPATCARDLDYLCHGVEEKNIKGCYKLKSVQPLDMFPHTPHIECICLLELR
ncbi:PREDICTED: uncharacterized protein LOC104810556 isoform X2 [Tarenaya hassleriana]|uniref:uncharacterized protein LOC104810556 isoform X2 n=1 Tax=Tarenaya hassleriana TaxID=28532 RepID=UPI00053C3CED|nr:PREDICTED: uncharacterized protein LOC104810556 isoform X2 [Tarenaya hassleriana]